MTPPNPNLSLQPPIPPEEQTTPAERLRWLRLSESPDRGKRPWSQKDLAQRARVTIDQVKEYEAGRQYRNTGLRDTLCTAVGVKPDFLEVSKKTWLSVIRDTGLVARPLIRGGWKKPKIETKAPPPPVPPAPKGWRMSEVKVCLDCKERFWPSESIHWRGWVLKMRCDICNPIYVGTMNRNKHLKQKATPA